MLRQLHRHSLWQGKHLPPVGVELDRTHPRAKDLLGLWIPRTPGLYGLVHNYPNGSAAVRMHDLSSHRRDAIYSRGPVANQTAGKWVVERDGPGFFLDQGQYGEFEVFPTRNADWNFQGAFTFMCRVRLNVLVTADSSQRVFVGRSDGAGALTTKWYWAWEGVDLGGGPNRVYFYVYENGGVNSRAFSTTTWNPNSTDLYTVAITRDLDKIFRFYVDGEQLGSTVTSTFVVPIPIDLELRWGHGEDFGANLGGTYLWMKAWERDLMPREVAAEHASPWDMVRLSLGVGGEYMNTRQVSFGSIV